MDEKQVEAMTEAINRLTDAIEKQNELTVEGLANQKAAMAKADTMQSMMSGIMGQR